MTDDDSNATPDEDSTTDAERPPSRRERGDELGRGEESERPDDDGRPTPPFSTSESPGRDDGPHVSVTIEGEYDRVIERLEHPESLRHSELEYILDNIESTLLAVVATGGGIRSEIYEAADFELDDPWEVRKYLEVLEMHDLVHLRDDQWVPSDYFEQSDRDGNTW